RPSPTDRRGRDSRRTDSLAPLYLSDQLLDVLDRGVLKDPVSEVEDVRAVRERVKNARHGGSHRLAAGNQRQGIQIALDGQVLRQFSRCPGRVHRLVKADRGDFSFGGISAELAA